MSEDEKPGAGVPNALEKPKVVRRYEVNSTIRRTLPIVLVLGLSGFFFASRPLFGILFGVFTLVNIGLWFMTRSGRRVLILDDEGYRVEIGGKEKLRVRWGEVRRIQALPSEQVIYLDCGDPERNLLVPPRYGYGYSYEKQDELYQLLSRVFGTRVETNENLLTDGSVPRTTPAVPVAKKTT